MPENDASRRAARMTSPGFRTIGLVGRFQDPQVLEPATAVLAQLRADGRRVLVAREDQVPAAMAAAEQVAEAELAGACDLVIAVGGDGTMLYALRVVARHGVPLIGINRGRLGFLTDISPEDMAGHLEAILAGRYVAEPRLLLEATITTADGHQIGPALALNEVVLTKHLTGHMLDVVTWINGNYLNTHGGDGLIIATPTGSTAYALSCGGPIMQPNVDALLMVPICPHTLSDRPLVLPSSSQIETCIEQRLDTRAQVICDGELLGDLNAGDRLQVRAAAEQATLLHPEDYNFYEILRSKLHWGHDGRWRRG
ncbi:MAG: NAD(+) kinase [Gammaproteobacteria bacterium]|nr:NAD(+) kinase [Gammaproteobacteria bacterium]